MGEESKSALFASCRVPDIGVMRPRCALCPLVHGAMKRTTDGRWVHLSCAMFVPGVKISDLKYKTGIDISKVRGCVYCCVV